MRRTKLLTSLIGTAILLAACGGGTPEPTAAPAPTEAPAAAPTEAPAAAPTEAPAAAPTEAPKEEAKPTEAPAAAPTEAAKELPMPAEFKEAPSLAGKGLPPVAERLPKKPLVTEAREAIGKYGGIIHTASWYPEVGNVQLYFGTDAPIKWKADLTGYEPALAESYEWSDDGKTFTLTLREGLKWSDGQPYTSADWKFWFEDLVKNPDYKGVSKPAYLRKSDGSFIDMEFPDERTIVWKSDKPQWIAPYYMAQGFWEFAENIMKPAHFLKQYHPKYTQGKTYDDLAKIDKYYLTPGYPCLFAWCLGEVSQDAQNYKFVRNPYYWRVDPEGNQLPYIDEIDIELAADEQVRILNCAQGKYDTAFRICGGPNEIPLLQEKAQAGDYKFLQNYMNGAGAWPGYMVNQYYVEGGKNYPDDTPEHAKEIRDVLRDKRFRQALSLGIDRQRVIDVAWNGIGDPKNTTISPQSWHFAGPEGQQVYKDWAASYAQFDADKANALLDEVGMKKGADGFRALPSGKEFEMIVDITDWGGSLKVQTDAAAEAKAQWENNLGLKTRINNLQGQPEENTRVQEGQYMLKGAHISEIDIWTYPDWIFPIVNRYMFPLEGRWYASGKDTCKPVEGQKYSCGVEPEEGSPAAKLQALYEKGQETKTIEDRHKVVWDAIKVIEDDGPFVIGVAGDQPMPIIVKNYMKNILDFGVVGPWAPATPGNQVPATWWMDK